MIYGKPCRDLQRGRRQYRDFYQGLPAVNSTIPGASVGFGTYLSIEGLGFESLCTPNGDISVPAGLAFYLQWIESYADEEYRFEFGRENWKGTHVGTLVHDGTGVWRGSLTHPSGASLGTFTVFNNTCSRSALSLAGFVDGQFSFNLTNDPNSMPTPSSPGLLVFFSYIDASSTTYCAVPHASDPLSDYAPFYFGVPSRYQISDGWGTVDSGLLTVVSNNGDPNCLCGGVYRTHNVITPAPCDWGRRGRWNYHNGECVSAAGVKQTSLIQPTQAILGGHEVRLGEGGSCAPKEGIYQMNTGVTGWDWISGGDWELFSAPSGFGGPASVTLSPVV